MNEFLRPPAVSGLFYPEDADTLRGLVRSYIDPRKQRTPTPPKALIAPHAGFPFSGDVAGTAYAQLGEQAERIKRVVLLGPSHRVAFRGIAASHATAFDMPMGQVAVDRESLHAIEELPGMQYLEAAHEMEHGLEVHLPFLQELLGDFQVVPLVVGDASPEMVGGVLESLWGGEETLVVISSDLSHFMDYDAACERDRATSEAIQRLDYDNVKPGDACGRNPINGLLWVARKRGLKASVLELCNSGDTAGTPAQVVGYGAYVFTE